MKKSEAVFALAKLISPTYNDKYTLESLLKSIEDDWEMIIHQANRYLLVPVLYKALQEKDVYKKLEDEMLRGYLYEIYTLNKQRNEAIMIQVQEMCSLLKNIEVTPLLLKGSTALSEHHFSDNAQRSMMDIDIVVPEVKIFEAVDLLMENGYKEINPDQKLGEKWHHYKRLYKEEGATSVELHRMLISYRAMQYMKDFDEDIDTQFATTIKNAKVFTPTYELYYTFLHAEVAHEYHDNIITLRHLHHSAVLITKYQNEIDFKKIQMYVKKYKLETTWYEYLWLLQQLFSITLPVHTPAMIRYEKQVCRKLDSEGSSIWFLERFIQRTQKAFSFISLQNKYDTLNYPYQLIYFIPKRFIFLSYKIITDKKRRKTILQGIKKTV